jgi:peptide-methionine (S)-S-oxide reductase
MALTKPLQQLSRSRILSRMPTTETAILGGGCFWCVEAAIKQLEGVLSVRSGYMGGSTANPTYQQVCSGKSGHVEVAEVTFDPAVISFSDLLHVFFTAHDPTTLNRQGNDVGEQYRSVIFYNDEAQKKTAEDVIAELTRDKVFSDSIVTAIEPASTFYVAEDYHQDYFVNNPNQPYCAYVVAPKVKKIREKYAQRLKA